MDCAKSDCNYVARPSLEKNILEAYNETLREKVGTYTILVGPKGAGKSSLVARVLQGKKGVVQISFNEGDTQASFINKLLESYGYLPEYNKLVGLYTFHSVLQEAAELDFPVTFVFKVTASVTSQNALRLAKSISESFAINSNVIIDLSDETGGLACINDDSKVKYIWVGDMEITEAEEYAKKLNPNVSHQELMYLFDKIGTLPFNILTSMNAHRSGKAIADIADQAVRAAYLDLIKFRDVSEAMSYFLRVLKLSPNGRSLHFSSMHTKELHVLMSEVKVAVYHPPYRDFQPASKAHRTALLASSQFNYWIYSPY